MKKTKNREKWTKFLCKYGGKCMGKPRLETIYTGEWSPETHCEYQ